MKRYFVDIWCVYFRLRCRHRFCWSVGIQSAARRL